ncbi:unnamed protein product [Prunus armeniaca]|uniref:Uncharacterized protein n=1 Tax=Prunus armeniaca TaxID=36596 RepID=A0A6J5UUU3_PRUAR|nr:unnamed protein product [Prunus armeniaca]CAB4310135.1 unnamed protein product [Prunus armeniaca]
MIPGKVEDMSGIDNESYVLVSGTKVGAWGSGGGGCRAVEEEGEGWGVRVVKEGVDEEIGQVSENNNTQ